MTVSIVRLRWRVRKGGAAQRPIDERLERDETMLKLDAGIARAAIEVCGFDSMTSVELWSIVASVSVGCEDPVNAGMDFVRVASSILR